MTSSNVTAGRCGSGSPDGTWPTTATPYDLRFNAADATVANVTAMSGPGSDARSHANRRMIASVLAAMVSASQSVSVATPRKPRTSSMIEPPS